MGACDCDCYTDLMARLYGNNNSEPRKEVKMWDDFYEPSEFETMIEEFKEELRSRVKKEYTDRIERLEAELASLKDIRDNYDLKVRELEVAKYNAVVKAANAKSEAKKATLRELLEPMRVDAWAIEYKTVYIKDKCDKCDAERYLHYITPMGREAKEPCECSKQKNVFWVAEAEVYELVGKSRGSGVKIYYQYEHQSDYDWDDGFRTTSSVYKDGTAFEDIKFPEGTIFLNREKAQEFCDWLNNKEEERVKRSHV